MPFDITKVGLGDIVQTSGILDWANISTNNPARDRQVVLDLGTYAKRDERKVRDDTSLTAKVPRIKK